MTDPANAYAFGRLRTTEIVSEATRRSMQGNRSTDTRPERALRRALWNAGFRGYRKNRAKLPGKPDVVFGKAKLAIFVHGCYWHQCPKCARNRLPKTNAEYWTAKFEANVARDERHQLDLELRGYQVLVVWECEIKSDLDRIVEQVISKLAR